MLEELEIQNFALIDHARVEFPGGFTVLSGETGAGKSLLIGSLSFLLGGRAGLEQIRSGCHEAQVSGVFRLDCPEASQWLSGHGIEAEDGRILLRRIVKDSGKSSSWIGGTPVTRADLASFASCLVDLHGQHEQQSLMKIAEHRRYLDVYAEITEEVQSFSQLYAQLVEKRRLLDSFAADEEARRTRVEMLNFAVAEIDEARLHAGEDEELEDEESRLASYEKLCGGIDEICALLEGGDDASGGILPEFRRLSGAAARSAALDKALLPLQDRLQSAFYELDDIAGEFRKYGAGLVFDPERLAAVQERLDLIYRLKKKYAPAQGAAVADVLAYGERARKELESLGGAAEDRSALEAEVSALEKQAYAAARALSAKRREAAGRMSAAVGEVLALLGMKDARFSVNLSEKPGNDVSQKCGPYGMDDIEFLLSANPGSPLQPLARVASGGELSRVMLALKTILSAGDTAGTLIFDEIDTGIGGAVAVSVGEHMKKLSRKKQVLCITHLASIAVYADNQIKIQKGVEGNSTATDVFPVTGQDRVREIARMLSGDVTSPESLEHAAAMLHKCGGL
ncbi:MAG: DNA repair protein RecN [Treponema sp.]|nr:DNA repair protein RecN [Treponema sp.]